MLVAEFCLESWDRFVVVVQRRCFVNSAIVEYI